MFHITSLSGSELHTGSSTCRSFLHLRSSMLGYWCFLTITLGHLLQCCFCEFCMIKSPAWKSDYRVIYWRKPGIHFIFKKYEMLLVMGRLVSISAWTGSVELVNDRWEAYPCGRSRLHWSVFLSLFFFFLLPPSFLADQGAGKSIRNQANR